MKLSSSLLVLTATFLLRQAEAAPKFEQDDKLKGYEKNGAGNGNSGGPKNNNGKVKRAVNGPPCASDNVASRQCGSDDEAARNRCCKGLVCGGDEKCADPCGEGVRTCCTDACEGMGRLGASAASSDPECCQLPIAAGTFPMIGKCIKPGERLRGVMVNTCEQLEVEYTGGSLGGCRWYKKNDPTVCMCNVNVVVKVEATSSRTVVATGQALSNFYESSCKP